VLFQLIVDRATELMGAASGSIIRVDRATGLLYIEAERGLGEAVKSKVRLRLGEGVTGWVAKEGQPLLVPDVRKDPRYVRPAPRSWRRWRCGEVGAEVVGVINLDHHEVAGFSEEDLELLTAFGHVAAVALRHAHAIDDSPRDRG